MNEVKIYHSISEVDKKQWDSLTENNVFMCYEYLRTFEETRVFSLMPYIITINDDERIVGASVCYFEQKNEARIIDKVILGKLLKYGFKKISFLPALICNRQRGDGTHFVFYPEFNNDQKILLQNKLLDEIGKIANKNNMPICFLSVTDDEIHLIESLKRRGYYQSIDLPSNFIDIKWTSFEGYMEYLSKKYSKITKTIRHELNRNRKSGVTIILLENLNNNETRLLELLRMNHFKYNSTRFPLKENYLHQLKLNFGNNALIYTALKDGVIIGVTIALRKGEEIFFANLAVDHEKSQNDFTFFNVGYYEPIKHAIQCKIKRIYFGRGLYLAKIKRGCTAKKMMIFYKPRNDLLKTPIKLWFGFHKQWMRHKLAYIKKL